MGECVGQRVCGSREYSTRITTNIIISSARLAKNIAVHGKDKLYEVQ